ERKVFLVLVAAHADHQLVEHAVELQAQISLPVGVLGFGLEDAVVAEESFGNPVGRIARRSRIVERNAAANIPAEAAGKGRLDEELLEIVVRLALADLARQ